MSTIGNISATKKEQKKQNYCCHVCNYMCTKKYNWDRHLNTPKHLKMSNGNYVETEKKEENAFFCEQCDKMYFNRTGLWRHKKKGCLQDNGNVFNEHQKLIDCLLKENAEFKHLMLEQNKQLLEQNKQVVELAKTAGHNNNNNNNNFNLQFFLNETCKNAMDIMDFVGQLQVKTEDLEETGRIGFADGISKIFVNGLKQIHVSDRPIHCSDVKREILYIKSNNEWSKENEEKPLLINAIRHVAHKNIGQIRKWAEIHPEFNNPSSRENDKYLKIVSESMCGLTPEETNKNYHKIIKTIIKETAIDK